MKISLNAEISQHVGKWSDMACAVAASGYGQTDKVTIRSKKRLIVTYVFAHKTTSSEFYSSPRKGLQDCPEYGYCGACPASLL